MNTQLLADLSAQLGVGDIFAWIEARASALAVYGWNSQLGRLEFTSRLLKACNVRLAPISENDGTNATIEWDDGHYVIRYRPAIQRSAARFAIAHEIGHTLWFANAAGVKPLSSFQIRDYRDATIESLANQFAAALLVPRDDLEKRVVNLRVSRQLDGLGLALIPELAAQYDVADQLIARRLLLELGRLQIGIVRIRRRGDRWLSSWSSVPAEMRRGGYIDGYRVPAHRNGRVLPNDWIPMSDDGTEQEVSLDGRWLDFLKPQPVGTCRKPLKRWNHRPPRKGHVFRSGDRWMLIAVHL